MPANSYVLWHGEIGVKKKVNKVDSTIQLNPQGPGMIKKEQEGFAKIVDTLKRKELRRWRKFYYKQIGEIEKNSPNFIGKDLSVMYPKQATEDTTLHHISRQLEITEERLVPA